MGNILYIKFEFTVVEIKFPDPDPENIYIGTSGWHYAHWKGPFYPEELPGADRLKFYAERFRSVEINNWFYQLPKQETLAQWRDSTSSDFIFALKTSRYITHMKKLKDGDKTFQHLAETVKVLESKLGPILFQRPLRATSIIGAAVTISMSGFFFNCSLTRAPVLPAPTTKIRISCTPAFQTGSQPSHRA
jgi:hypothetical protein